MKFSDVGHDEFTNKRYVPEIRVVPYDHADLDAVGHTLTIDVPAGVYMLWVGHHISEAFDGGVPSCDIGDGSDADAWVDTTDISETTLNDWAMSLGKANALSGGKYFATAGKVVVTHAAGLTAGKGEVHLCFYAVAPSWRESMPPAWSEPHPANWGM